MTALVVLKMRTKKIDIYAKLASIPVGRWTSIQVKPYPIDVYQCDTEDGKCFIIETQGHPKVRLNVRDSVHLLKTLIDDDEED